VVPQASSFRRRARGSCALLECVSGQNSWPGHTKEIVRASVQAAGLGHQNQIKMNIIEKRAVLGVRSIFRRILSTDLYLPGFLLVHFFLPLKLTKITLYATGK
jgi:hypothetical protein